MQQFILSAPHLAPEVYTVQARAVGELEELDQFFDKGFLVVPKEFTNEENALHERGTAPLALLVY